MRPDLRYVANQKKLLSKASLAQALGMRQATGQLHQQVRNLLNQGQIEMTLPAKPNSRLQKYRLTNQGRQLQPALSTKHSSPQGIIKDPTP